MRRSASISAALLGLVLTGCSSGSAATATSSDAVSVSSGDKSCDVSRTALPAGATVFAIKNTGSQATEVYVYGKGDAIAAEKENIGPGISFELKAQLEPGTYEVMCKPGMTGDGIRTPITVTAAS